TKSSHHPSEEEGRRRNDDRGAERRSEREGSFHRQVGVFEESWPQGDAEGREDEEGRSGRQANETLFAGLEVLEAESFEEEEDREGREVLSEGFAEEIQEEIARSRV